MSGQNTAFRGFVVIVALVAVALLWWVSWQAWSRWDAKVSSQQEVTRLKQKVNDYTKLEAEYEGYKKYQMLKAKLDAQLEEKQLLARYWDKRHVQVNNEDLSRAKVQDYLEGLGKETRYLFVPTNLVIQTLSSEESMFSWNPGDADRLRFSLEGDYYMRREQ